MKKRIVRWLLFLVYFGLFSFKTTNAVFISREFVSGNFVASGDWTAPESEIDWLDDYQSSNFFTLTYFAFDDVSEVDRVLLYYRYQGGDWQLTAEDDEVTGFFDFEALNGDGQYEFLSIAVDTYGNIEDDGELLPFGDTLTIVDTTPPVTMLSVEPYLAVANEQLYNGGFENENLDGWEVDSSGSDHQATSDDSKTGSYSALIGFQTTAPLTEPAYDSISQTVTLSSWQTSTLSFWYRLITSDLVSGGFFDALVIPTGGDSIIVAHDGWDDPEVFEEDLDWQNVTYQLTDLEGEEVEFQFKVTQPYEDYQTWAYLDDVKVCAAENFLNEAEELTLNTSDGAGSDNAVIYYSIDGGAEEEYLDPISLEPGAQTVVYHSEDEAGNIEEEKEIEITVQEEPVDFGVVLNEILALPASGDEWIKLFNNSDADIDAADWHLENLAGETLVISGAETVVPAGGILTVYCPEAVFSIGEDEDTIELYNGAQLIDSYHYLFEPPLETDKTISRDPEGTGAWKDPEMEKLEELEEVKEGVLEEPIVEEIENDEQEIKVTP